MSPFKRVMVLRIAFLYLFISSYYNILCRLRELSVLYTEANLLLGSVLSALSFLVLLTALANTLMSQFCNSSIPALYIIILGSASAFWLLY